MVLQSHQRFDIAAVPAGDAIVVGLEAEIVQGDIVLTLAGDELSAQPVKWLGHRRIDLTAHPRPETVAPIRIQRDAFADNMPHRDLLVSPDHAIFVDGKLICARQLVNGTTIRQEHGWTSVDYYHVELDAHAILLAEGLPAESYLDTGNRGFFANSGAPLVLHPDLTDETDYPTREAGSCAPFVWDEASVRPVWQRLADRAAALGRPVPQRDTTTDAGLQLVAKGRTIKPIFATAIASSSCCRAARARCGWCHVRSRRPRRAPGWRIAAGLACGWRASCCAARMKCGRSRWIIRISREGWCRLERDGHDHEPLDRWRSRRVHRSRLRVPGPGTAIRDSGKYVAPRPRPYA